MAARIIFVFLLLAFAGAVNSALDVPRYPNEFELRGCSITDERERERRIESCKNCAWIRTSEGWIVTCHAE